MQKEFAVRQGDVLVKTAHHRSGVIADAKEEPREGGRVVLAHGEVTGHAHAVAEPGAKILVDQREERFLRMMNPGDLVHDEHATLRLPDGTYKVIRQSEYTPEAIRNVAD